MKVNEIWGGGSLAGVGAELAKRAGGEENWNATAKQSKQIWDAVKNKFVNVPGDPATDKSDTVSSMPTVAPTASPATRRLAQGVSIVSNEPIIIKYKNREFGLNNKGQWANIVNNKIPPENFQQFLNNQHDISLGATTTQVPSVNALPANAVNRTKPPTATPPAAPPTATPPAAPPTAAERRQQQQQAATQAARASMRPVPAKPQVLRQNPERAKMQQQLAARQAANAQQAQQAEREADWNRHASGSNEE